MSVENSQPRVLLVTSNFWPEDSGIAVYSSDIAFNVLEDLAEVTVLTGLPHYPWWRIPEEFAELTKGSSQVKNVNVVRLKHFIPSKSSALRRSGFELSFWLNGRKALRKLDLTKFDLVISIMPTVSSGLLGRHVSRVAKVPGLTVFQDISHIGASESGIPGGRFLHIIARVVEKFASQWATEIVVVSEAMVATISHLTNDKIPINLIHNYSLLNPSSLNKKEAREILGINEDVFLVLHTGNMGHKQDLLNVTRAARILANHQDIRFMLVGHGNQEVKIRSEVTDCENIEMRSFFSTEDFPKALASANILLVNEIPTMHEMALPSKLTAYLSSGTPVLAAVSPGGATSKFLGDVAFTIQPGNPRALADAVLKLKEDVSLRQQLSKKAKSFSEEHLSLSAGRKKYLNLFERIRSQG